ncbi:hypothetical protein DMX06_23765 [Pseudomonas mosselii]|nr:hypothetical protein DMX06_23765 [Pseudomonas mosselii]
MKILNFIFGKPGDGMTAKEKEISDSIKKLKSLSVVDGRISIDVGEVLTEEFVEKRKKARRLLNS